MSHIFASLFPIFDHLYIYQSVEYDLGEFFRWLRKHPFARRLQQRRRLVFTQKMRYLAAITLAWMLLLALVPALLWGRGIAGAVLLFLVLQQASPLFVALAHYTYLPLDNRFKSRIVAQARGKLQSHPELRVIGITGSYGKTSTKDILYVLLQKQFRVVKTPKSFNTTVSVAQTVLDYVKPNTELFLAEVGAYRRGDIARVAAYLRPTIGVITAIGPQHLERFGSMEAIAAGKFELVEALPSDGIAFINSRAQLLRPLLKRAPCRVVLFGGPSDPYHADDITVGPEGTRFTLRTPRGTKRISVPLIGEHHAQNFVAAAAVASELGVPLETIEAQAEALLPTPHRLEIKQQGALTIIDNTYNTNPESVKASLKLLQTYPGTQKVLVTPGLVELGAEEAQENRRFAAAAAQVVDRVIVVGRRGRAALLEGLAEAHFPRDQVVTVETLNEAMGALQRISLPGSVVLLENDLPDHYT